MQLQKVNADWPLLRVGGVTYAYDGDGHRVKKSSGTLYWGAALAESDLTGSTSSWKDYIFFNGARVAKRDSTTTHYFFSDELGSTSVVRNDSTGALEEDMVYSPYGVTISGTSADHYLFNGKERDTESGFDEYGARYYSSAQGRFTIPDWAVKPTAVPYANFGNPQSLNLYSYVQNNPTTLGDPDGHQEEKAPKEEAREDALEFKELDEAGEWFREREAEQQVIEGAKPDAMIANNNNDDPVTGMCYVNTPSHRDAIEARREQLDPQIRMGGRLGNSATRALDREVANKLEKEGYTVTNGAGKPQEYIPGPNGARKGSAYPDVTATKDGETVRVNTVDTKKDGALTPREQRNAEKIQQARPNDQFKTVPKKPNEK